MSQLVSSGKQGYFDFDGFVIPDRANLKTLWGFTSTANNYSAVREPGSTTNYQVPASTVFKVLGIICYEFSNNACAAMIGYGDTAATYGGGAAPTTPIAMAGGGAATAIIPVGAYSTRKVPCKGFSVPASKYPYVHDSSGSGSIGFLVVGYEESV